MLLPQKIVYRPSPSAPYRKGGTWIDVDETTSGEAPVVLEHVYGDFIRQYRMHDGRLWQLQHSDANAQMSMEAIRLVPDRTSPAIAHRLSTEIIGVNDRAVGWTYEADDEMDDAPGLRGSDAYKRLVKIAGRGRLLIDGVLHRATPGPLYFNNWHGELEHHDMGLWSSCSPIVMARLRPLENGLRGQGIGRLVQHAEFERLDTTAMNVEAAAWVLVLETSKIPVGQLPRDSLPLLALLRNELRSRHPEPWYDFKVKCIDPIPVDDDGRPWPSMDHHLLDAMDALASLELGMSKRVEGIHSIVEKERARLAMGAADELAGLRLP